MSTAAQPVTRHVCNGGAPVLSGAQTARLVTIMVTVAAASGISVLDILSGHRAPRFVEARHTAMWIMRRRFPLTTIGWVMGGRDHTTVMYGVARIDHRMAADGDFAERVLGLVMRCGMGA